MEDRDLYVSAFPGSLLEKLAVLQKAGFTYREMVIKAVSIWLEKGLDACGKELVQEKLKALGVVEEKGGEKVVE